MIHFNIFISFYFFDLIIIMTCVFLLLWLTSYYAILAYCVLCAIICVDGVYVCNIDRPYALFTVRESPPKTRRGGHVLMTPWRFAVVCRWRVSAICTIPVRQDSSQAANNLSQGSSSQIFSNWAMLISF